MKTFLIPVIGLALIAPATLNADQTAALAVSPAAEAFKKMKTLVGKWEGTMGEGGQSMAATVEYRLTGSGTALVETLGPGSPFEMVSVYHMDGDSLVMTHYCGAGNQPSMKLKPGKNPNALFFDFTHGSNMKPADMHMRQVTHTFMGPDHVKSVWQSYTNGKPSMKAAFDFKRVKA